jgi:hypothetical protein
MGIMGRLGLWSDWVDALEANDHGTKLLTLRKACYLASLGESAGWYVAPHATHWTVGRTGSADTRYHILDEEGEPILSETEEYASQFLSRMLSLARSSRDSRAPRDFSDTHSVALQRHAG